jgi:hypothetical protein
MTRFLVGLILGLILGVYLADRANAAAVLRQRYTSVKASEPDGPTSLGTSLEDVLK